MTEIDTMAKDWTAQVVALQAKVARLRAALLILQDYNPLHNDLDAYLIEVADWGLGERDTPPDPEAFGLRPQCP
jgi:hypothetical protein